MHRVHIALLGAALSILLTSSSYALAQEEAWAALREEGIAVLRHAAPNREHDPQVLLRAEECQGQRWLSEVGQAQVAALGTRFRREGISVATVFTSPLCPARATAEAIGSGGTEVARGLLVVAVDGSQWSSRAGDVLRNLITDWRGRGALMLVKHLGNIAALTGVTVDPGERLVALADGSGMRLIGRLPLD